MSLSLKKSATPSNYRSFGLLAVVVCAASVVPARAGSIIANNFTSPPSYSGFDLGVGFAGDTSNGPFTNETPAQEFTAQNSGVITQIIASVGQFLAQGIPLTVTVSQAAGSIPGSVLGSLTFATNQVSSNAFSQPSTFDFSATHITLLAGDNYFVTFSVATPINESIRYQALLLNTGSPVAFGFPAIDSPDGGASWLPPAVPNEIGLTIVGAAVPEPASIAMLGLGLVGISGVLLRRRLRTV